MDQKLLENWLERRKSEVKPEVALFIEELLFNIEFSIFEGEDSA